LPTELFNKRGPLPVRSLSFWRDGRLGTGMMVRKIRIAAVAAVSAAVVVAVALWAAYRSVRQVRPFYQDALALDRDVLEQGRQELESRATALYSDANKVGKWQALFTDEQINGWLATELAEAANMDADDIAGSVHEPRVAISPGILTFGFTTTQSGVDTVVSVDASVFLTDEGDVAVRLMKVQAGTLPLPAGLVADELAAACERLPYPVVWSERDGERTAVIKIGQDATTSGQQFHIDAIELTDGELYVAGHTEATERSGRTVADRAANGDKPDGGAVAPAPQVDLADFELHLTPEDNESMLEIARRRGRTSAENSAAKAP
jgi:hypothetical protein